MGKKIFSLTVGFVLFMAMLGGFRLPPVGGAAWPDARQADTSPGLAQDFRPVLTETAAIWKVKDVFPTPNCYTKFDSQGQQLAGEQSFDIWTGFEAQPLSWKPGELVVKIGYQFPGQAAPIWKFPEYHLSDEISSKPIGYQGPLADPTVVVNYYSRNYIGFIKSKFLIPRSQMNGEGKIMVSIETHGKIKVVKEEKSNPLKACPIF